MTLPKRLTERIGDGVRYDNGEYTVTCYPQNGNLCAVDKIAVRLCVLEDKLEDGSLVALPLRIGDKIYSVLYDTIDDEWFMTEETVTEVGVRGCFVSGYATPRDDLGNFIAWDSFGNERDGEYYSFARADAERFLSERGRK